MGYPDLIILDEPTVGLDPKQVIEIRELIKTLSQKHTIILSSHILSEVSAVCDEIMIINKGKLVVRDNPEKLAQADGDTSLAIKAKGTREQIESILASINGIDEVTFNEDAVTDEGVIQVTVSYKKGKELRDEISFAFAGARCPIYEMKSSVLSLEEIFLQLTNSGEEAVTEVKEEKPAKVYETVEEAIGSDTESLLNSDVTDDKEGK